MGVVDFLPFYAAIVKLYLEYNVEIVIVISAMGCK